MEDISVENFSNASTDSLNRVKRMTMAEADAKTHSLYFVSSRFSDSYFSTPSLNDLDPRMSSLRFQGRLAALNKTTAQVTVKMVYRYILFFLAVILSLVLILVGSLTPLNSQASPAYTIVMTLSAVFLSFACIFLVAHSMLLQKSIRNLHFHLEDLMDSFNQQDNPKGIRWSLHFDDTSLRVDMNVVTFSTLPRGTLPRISQITMPTSPVLSHFRSQSTIDFHYDKDKRRSMLVSSSHPDLNILK